MCEVDQYGWTDAKHPNSCSYLGDEILPILEDLQPERILDLGCGNGALCHLIKQKLPNSYVVGVDYDKEGVDIACKSYPSIEFYNYGVQDDPEELLQKTCGEFDLVISTEVIEHLYLPGQLPEYANRVLKPGGKLIITTPYHGYLKNLILSILNKWDGHHTALWDGGHIKFWSKKTLSKLLSQYGFAVHKFRGVGRFSYVWKSMLLICQKT